MPIDREYLRQHYASLSDDALAAIDRDDLVEAAQKLYDEERARRGLGTRRTLPGAFLSPARDAIADEYLDPGALTDAESNQLPAWLEGAACACAFVDYPGTHLSPQAAHARDALQAAGIPCYVTTEKPADPQPQGAQLEYRVLVPGGLHLKALSILDKEIFNAEMEADWKAHFEDLSDDTLRELSPEVICAGLADRIDRLTRLYNEEVARRAIQA